MHLSVKFINRSTYFYSGEKTKWWIHRWIWGKKWTMKWVNAMTLLSVHKYKESLWSNKWRKTFTKTCHKVTPVWRFEKCINSILWMTAVHTSVKYEWFWSQIKLGTCGLHHKCSLDQPSLIPQGSLSDFERCQLLINLTLLSSSINITAEVGHVTVHLCFWESQIS